MFSVNQPFDSNKFNFTKVKEEEILFQLKHKNRTTLTKDQIIINVSLYYLGPSLLIYYLSYKRFSGKKSWALKSEILL